MRSKLFQRRFVVVAGKGGVGRSTVCVALGLAAARYGLRTCIVQLNTQDDVARLFGCEAGSYAPVPLDPDLPLFAANLRPTEALREYGQLKLRWKALHHLVFENDVMRRLLRMVPGMSEMLLLGKAWHMEARERRDDGTPAWDLLIVDAPATGHGISLLRLPQVILDAVPVGPMAEDARRMKELLEDPLRTSFHVVTLPQELPATEAIELCELAQTTLGVPTGYLFINAVLPRLLGDTQRRLLLRAEPTVGETQVRQALQSVEAYEHWREAQQAQVQRLRRAVHLPVVELPYVFERMDRTQVELLSQAAVASMETTDTRRRVGEGAR